MLVYLGRMPTAIAAALGAVDQGGGIVFDVSLPVAAILRALGGSIITADTRLTEDALGNPIGTRYEEDGVTIRKTE